MAAAADVRQEEPMSERRARGGGGGFPRPSPNGFERSGGGGGGKLVSDFPMEFPRPNKITGSGGGRPRDPPRRLRLATPAHPKLGSLYPFAAVVATRPTDRGATI